MLAAVSFAQPGAPKELSDLSEILLPHVAAIVDLSLWEFDMNHTKLVCTQCGKEYSANALHYRCGACNEPLEARMDKTGRIHEGNSLTQTFLERYADFFPYFKGMNKLTLGEGFTSLLESDKLADEMGIGRILFKNESQNPTWSFKDRGTLTGILHAISLGYDRIATVSSGNMAVSAAAYGAKANLKTYVFVSDKMPAEKLNPIAVYGPTLIAVSGRYDLIQKESYHLCEKYGVYMLGSDVPFRVEGYKSLAFEVCEQMGFDVPDFVMVPNSAGGHLRGIEKGFREFKASGLIKCMPKPVCVQASGCAPIVNAFAAGADRITRVESPHTIAHGIENAFPLSGNQVLRIIKKNDGYCVSVTDEEILNAQATLAKMGLFVQPESAATLAAVKKMKSENIFCGKETILCVLTGGGLKHTAVFEHHDLKYTTCTIREMERFFDSAEQ
jgi:threonine synthase